MVIGVKVVYHGTCPSVPLYARAKYGVYSEYKYSVKCEVVDRRDLDLFQIDGRRYAHSRSYIYNMHAQDLVLTNKTCVKHYREHSHLED